MALHMALTINGQSTGEGVIVTRLRPPGALLEPDDVCTYRVEVYRNSLPISQFEVEHRYGDGAMALMAKALHSHTRIGVSESGEEYEWV